MVSAPRRHTQGDSNKKEYKFQYLNWGSTMLSIKIFKNTEIIKHMMVNIKLHLYWHYVCHNSEKFLAKVQCFFAFYAVYACKRLTPSCAIQGYPVPVARAGVYRARRYSLGDQKKCRPGMWHALEIWKRHAKSQSIYLKVGDSNADGWMVLIWIVKRQVATTWTEVIRLRLGSRDKSVLNKIVN